MKTRLFLSFAIATAIMGGVGSAFYPFRGVSNLIADPGPERNPKPTGREKARAWFFNERAYPTGSIPAGAMEKAWRESMAAIEGPSKGPDDPTVGDRWTSIGPASIIGGQLEPGATNPDPNPRVSGRIVDIAVDPDHDDHWYIAADTGGIWETTNGGSSWTPRTDDQVSLEMCTITIAPSNPQILFATTRDTSGSVLKSENGGASWTQHSIFPNLGELKFTALRVHPTNPNIVMASTWCPSQTYCGVFKSTNGGARFFSVQPGPATALVTNPLNFNQQYAAIRGGDAPNATYNGVYRSLDDEGASWKAVEDPPWGPLAPGPNEVRIAISPSNPDTIYVVVPGTGFWKTDDAWAETPTWTELTRRGLPFEEFAKVDTAMVDPIDPTTFYIGEGRSVGFYRLMGGSWSSIIAGTHIDQHALAAAGSTILLGNDGGFWTSTDQGTTWTNRNSNLAVVQFYAGSLHPTDATSALGGSQDNGTELWSGSAAWTFKLGGDGGYSAFSTLDPTTWLVSAQDLDIYRMTGSGANFTRDQINLDRSGAGFIAPIKRSPHSDIILAGSNKLQKSTDFFTAPIPTWASNNPEVMQGPIRAIAFASYDASSQTYAFSAGGQLRLTMDGGAHWSDLDPNYQVPNRVITAIAFHPTSLSIIYVALSGFNGQTPGQSGHIFKTTDSGENWSDVGPTADVPMNSLAIDPADPNRIFAGADLGVWKTSNGGTSWSLMGPGSGMPNVKVLDLVFGPADGHLVAYTYGRGAFKLNVGSLQVTIEPKGAASAGAKWRVDDGVYQTSGTTVTGLAPGFHTVSFGPAEGYTAPENETVTISLNDTTTTTGVYLEPK